MKMAVKETLTIFIALLCCGSTNGLLSVLVNRMNTVPTDGSPASKEPVSNITGGNGDSLKVNTGASNAEGKEVMQNTDDTATTKEMFGSERGATNRLVTQTTPSFSSRGNNERANNDRLVTETTSFKPRNERSTNSPLVTETTTSRFNSRGNEMISFEVEPNKVANVSTDSMQQTTPRNSSLWNLLTRFSQGGEERHHRPYLSSGSTNMNPSCTVDQSTRKMASVNCLFDDDLNETKTAFAIVHFPDGQKGTDVVLCNWDTKQETTVLECASTQGYTFDQKVSRRLKVEIHYPSKRHEGLYACHTVPSGKNSPTMCKLELPSKRDMDVVIVHSKPPGYTTTTESDVPEDNDERSWPVQATVAVAVLTTILVGICLVGGIVAAWKYTQKYGCPSFSRERRGCDYVKNTNDDDTCRL